jgi:flagellar protein FlaG
MANEVSTQLNKIQVLQVGAEIKKDQPSGLGPASVYASSEPVSKTAEPSETKDSAEQASEKIKAKVTQLNEQMQNLNRSLQFSVDEESGDSVITVKDVETEEVIRQFPSDELLRARNSIEDVKGLLIRVDV